MVFLASYPIADSLLVARAGQLSHSWCLIVWSCGGPFAAEPPGANPSKTVCRSWNRGHSTNGSSYKVISGSPIAAKPLFLLVPISCSRYYSQRRIYCFYSITYCFVLQSQTSSGMVQGCSLFLRFCQEFRLIHFIFIILHLLLWFWFWFWF